MNPQPPRQPPSLDPPAAEPRAPDLFAPKKERPPSTQDRLIAPSPRKPERPKGERPARAPRPPRSFASILLWIIIGALVLVLGPVLMIVIVTTISVYLAVDRGEPLDSITGDPPDEEDKPPWWRRLVPARALRSGGP